jgi:hypothetical protein
VDPATINKARSYPGGCSARHDPQEVFSGPNSHLLANGAVVLTLTVPASAEWKEKVLYSFQGGNDGAYPAGGVVFDKQGNLYGTTQAGGPPPCAPIGNSVPPCMNSRHRPSRAILGPRL